MRRRHRKNKRHTIFILVTVCMIGLMTVGYAAFSTNLNITARGNIKNVYHTVSFKTQLLENNTFEEGAENWEYSGCAGEGGFEISDAVTYNGHKSVRIYENNGGIHCWNGIRQNVEKEFNEEKKYEISLYMKRDSTSIFGDLNNTIREYASLGDEKINYPVWIFLEKRKTSEINITNNNLIDNEWTYISDYGNRPSNDDYSNNFIRTFNIDYLAREARTEASNVWIALPSLYEVEEKQIKKYNKIGTLPVAGKEGYTFTGWYTDEFNGEKIDENFEITDDINLYARFIKN